MNNTKLIAYRALLETAKQWKDILANDENFSFDKLEKLVQLGEMEQRFGIPLREDYHNNYQVQNSYDNWTRLRYFEDGGISWSDDGKQPKDEWLFQICFTCGAYIFGDSYPTKTFEAMFKELKGYNPKYVDSVNHCLYYTEENSKAVYDNFWVIINKWRSFVNDEIKEKRKLELQEELDRLNGVI